MSHFNSIAGQWDTPEKIAQSKIYADHIKKHLPSLENLSILEIGCGTGLLGSQFLTTSNSLLGIDTSIGMLDVFKEKFKAHPNAQAKLINLEADKLDENQKFDLVLSSMAFHHLKDPSAMIEKIKKLLKPQGIIAVIDLDAEDGSFHPDPKNMGVFHFGFSEEQTTAWANESKLFKIKREIINIISKNQKNYPIFLEVFKNSPS